MKFLIERLKTASLKKYKDTVISCSKKSNKGKLYIYFDIIRCFLLYRAGYVDYEIFGFYNLTHKQRKTILTRGKNNDLVRASNPKEYWNIMDDKFLFNETFKKYVKRDYMKLDQNNYLEFCEFIKEKDEIFVKPIDATGGKGADKIILKDYNSKDLYNKLIENNQLLIEDVAKQHEGMSKLHPNSVNTVRIVTLKNKYNVVSIIAAVVRMGTGNNVVDNFHSHGIYSPIDINTGKISGAAYGRDGIYYDLHPTTNVKLLDYQLPLWEEVRKLAYEVANVVPELNYVGWDICIGNDGPSLIEGNPYPGYDLYRRLDNYGILPIINEALNKK